MWCFISPVQCICVLELLTDHQCKEEDQNHTTTVHIDLAGGVFFHPD